MSDAPDLYSCEYAELFRTPGVRLCKFKFFLKLLCMRSGIPVFRVTVVAWISMPTLDILKN
jgi:hypothetical protein